MTARIVILSMLLLAACSTATPATSQGSSEQAAEQPVADAGLVIEPLVPQEDLPPGTDLHYDFAHFVMPLVVFSSPPEKVREQFLGPTANEFLERQWKALFGAQAAEVPTGQKVTLEVGEALLIELPPPQRNAHAYFTLIVFKDSGPIRYMTLERSVFMKDDDPRRTVIGEWSIEKGEPAHGNFGEGPEPEPGAFLEAVIEYIR